MQTAALFLPKNSVGFKKKNEPVKYNKEVKKTSFKKIPALLKGRIDGNKKNGGQKRK